MLNTGRTVEHWHTRTKTGKVPILERLSPNAWLEMNPRDARGLRLKPQDRVDVVSRRGRIRDVELRLTETVAPGQVFVPFHYAEANANQVTQSEFDPYLARAQLQAVGRARRARGRGRRAMKRLVVVGNGMAGMDCLEQILRHEPQFQVTVFGDETHVNYNRIMLSSVLAGEKPADDIVINPLEWYQRNQIDLRVGVRVVDVDSEAKTVTGDDGRVTPYDTLLLATGSSAFLPPIDGLHKSGVLAFRTLDDTREILRRAGPGVKAVVIGGGLLGLEAARGLQVQGCDVTVVHLASTLMERQLDPDGGQYLLGKIEDLGVRVLLGRTTTAILGERPRGRRGALRRQHARSRAGGGGRRHPAERGAGLQGRPARQPRHRRQRLHGDLRSRHLRGRRVRGAPRASATAWWRRSSSRARCWPRP